MGGFKPNFYAHRLQTRQIKQGCAFLDSTQWPTTFRE